LRREWVDTVMDIFNIHRVQGVSYIEIVLLLLESGETFTVKELATRTQIYKKNIYRMIETHPQFFEKTPTHTFPDDYEEYSVKRKRRYRKENGLPVKGTIPTRYRLIKDTTPIIEHIKKKTRETIHRLNELQQTYPPIQEKPLEAAY